ncbi:hypothetical protein ACFQL4_01600 [Halosimplex aquaticum]
MLVAIPGVLTVSALAGVTFASARDDGSRTRSARELLPFGVAAGVVAGVGHALDSVGGVALAAGDGVGVPAWLPQFGTVGTTVTTYIQVGQLAGDLAVVGGGLALGVLAVRRAGLTAPSRRFVVATATGALGGSLLAWLPIAWFVTADRAGPGLATVAAAVPNVVVSTAFVAVLAVVAGVGVARFEADGSSGSSGGPDAAGFEAVTETPVSERSLRDH